MRALGAVLVVLLTGFATAPAAAGEPDPTAPAYEVALTGSERGMRWSGRETISLTNPGAAPLEVVWVRLWGNGGWGCRGTRHVRIANVAGATADAPGVFCSAVPLRLSVPLAPGARGSVAFDVEIRVPDEPGRFGRRGRLALLSNAIPALAHLEGGAWRLDRYFPAGEAWTYPAAEWTVRLDPPAGISVAAPGVAQPDGSRRLERGRDYSFAAGPLRSRRETIDGVEVSVWAARGGRGADLRRVMRITRRRLPQLSAAFGPYGWPDLQIVINRDAAMEHTGLIMTSPRDFVVTHELAHEWWYALIGNDQAASPWLDEGFATYAEEVTGAQTRPWCRRTGRGAWLVTRGTEFFRKREYRGYGAVYVEGACLLDLLRRRIGRERFATALRDYAVANRYGWSTPAEFRAAMDTASPVPLDDLWSRYRVS